MTEGGYGLSGGGGRLDWEMSVVGFDGRGWS